MKLILSFLAISLITSSFTYQKNSVQLHNGDLIFIKSSDPHAKLMKKATGSRYNHCGIIILDGPNLAVLEVTDAGIRYTDLPDFYNKANGKIVMKRLKNLKSYISDSSVTQYNNFKAKKDYYRLRETDKSFSWSDSTLYNSEMVWKFYKELLGVELCPLQTLKDFNTKNRKVKATLKAAYGENIPFDEKVVSIKSLYNSELLETVETR